MEKNSLTLVWGVYDLGKERVRILIDGLRTNGMQVREYNSIVWEGVDDKSQLRGFGSKLRVAMRWLFSYPKLIWCYLRSPSHGVVLVPYLGHLDVLLIWPFAKLRGAAIVWDVFISLYETVVEDRCLVGPRHPLAMLLWGLEWLACRAADRIVLDTDVHGRYFVETFGASPEKVRRVFVGAETDMFPRAKMLPHPSVEGRPFTVLFYGQFIPLHGIETVVRAAHLCNEDAIRWVLIGKGQEQARIRALMDELQPCGIQWVEWVPYDELVDWIADSDVCLGIFGTTAKASRVIPNKVFQILAVGRPLITMDSPSVREFLSERPGIVLIPPGDPTALAQAVRDWVRQPPPEPQEGWHSDLAARISPQAVGHSMCQVLRELPGEMT